MPTDDTSIHELARANATRLKWIAAGYAASLLAAIATVVVYQAVADRPDAGASAGMYAFGDAVLFIGTWGTCSLAPTAALLYLFRRSKTLWRAMALTGAVLLGCIFWLVKFVAP
jgi:hypothetical protein